MNVKSMLLSAFLLWAGIIGNAPAQTVVKVGSQVTSEAAIVPGRPYVLQSQATGTPYVAESSTYYSLPNAGNTATLACVYCFIDNGDGTWRIRNYSTESYWGVPVFNTALVPADVSHAGHWSLNFSAGIAYPSAPDAGSIVRGINRSGQILVAHDTGTGAANKLKIFECSLPRTLTLGSQVTTEASITDGKSYIVQYVGNNASYVNDDNGSNYNVNNVSALTDYTIYSFHDNGDGTWKIKNTYTGKYWSTISGTSNITPVAEASAGNYTLNFSSNQMYPKVGDSWLSRSGGKLHGWASNANSNFKVYEVEKSSTMLPELAGFDMHVSATAADNIKMGQWYVMFDRGDNHGYLYENSSTHGLLNTATAPGVLSSSNCKYLVRLVDAGDSKYYLQTGYGNYIGQIVHSTQVYTTAMPSERITVAKISSTDAHFYLQSETGAVVLNANDLSLGDATVVGWGTTVPTSTGGNDDWAFYPVSLELSFIPSDTEVYTISNSNSRGALIYDPAKSETYVWSSGKSGATAFDASNANHQWMLLSTGVANLYYLYNVGARMFAVPSSMANGGTTFWKFSENAVAVKLEIQSDGNYKIKAAVDPVNGTNYAYVSISNGKTNPVFNYNDEGSVFFISKQADATSAIQTQATADLNKLVCQQTALTNFPSADGWYVIQINSKTGAASYSGRYLFPRADGALYNSLYPLTFTGDIAVQPAITDATYFTYIDYTSWDVNTWQLPDGRYLVDNGSNKFPTPSATAGNVICGYDSGNYFKTNNNYYADPYNNGANYYIGETTTKRTSYTAYPIDLATAGLVAWRVVCDAAPESAQITCSRSDVSGLTSVFKNGYFFLPTGVTPVAGDFDMEGMIGSPVIDSGEKTITLTYDPTLAIHVGDVAVVQGHQTTGKGNTMQALLRVQLTPFKACTPTQVNISLTGASQIDHVAVYTTTVDELYAAGVTPTKISGDVTPAEGTLAIPTGLASALTADETIYLWVTADVKSTATELATVDASITSIDYSAGGGNNSCELTSKGDPTGEMCIYKQQAFLWTSTQTNTQYYRIPTILNTADGGIAAFSDYRYSSTEDLGRPASGHKIDVVMRKSMDDGQTWAAPQTIAVGDGSTAAAFGYGDPAVVRTLSGKLICLMAAGQNSYATGMLHVGYTVSTDNGATWSAPTDIYSSINKNGIAFQSVFTTAGKGVTFSNGRVAFAMNGKVSGTTNEYILYSDDEGATWTIMPTAVFTGADESKLEIMNDNSLLISVRCGNYNSMANRGHNRSTDDASGSGISTWGTQGNWTDMNANGCNADILYYSRSTDGQPDILLHTLTKNYSEHRKDLRLYMSLDGGDSWSEIYKLQPGYAAYSSMQKLASGDLAIIYEDGSVGNVDKHDCYAINYITLSREKIMAKYEELRSAQGPATISGVTLADGTNAPSDNITWDGSGWRQFGTTKAASGLAGLSLSSTYSGAFNQSNNIYGSYVIAMKVSATDATDDITLTAPSGYWIMGYELKARSYNEGKNYTLTAGETTLTTIYSEWRTFSVTNVNAASAVFSVTTDRDQTYYLCVKDFVVYVAPTASLTLNVAAGHSYATAYLPYGYTLTGDVKAFKLRVSGSRAIPTSVGNDVPADTPVMLYSPSAATSVTVMRNDDATASMDGNILRGSPFTQFVNGYVLNAVDGVPGFYRLVSPHVVPANRAYIPMDVMEASIKGISISWNWDDEDAIEPINEEPIALQRGNIYDLSGRRITTPRRGLYIVNGKKVLIKQ